MKTRFVSIGRVINYRNGCGDNPAAAYTLRSMKYRKTVLKLAISASRSRFSIGHCCFSVCDVVRVLFCIFVRVSFNHFMMSCAFASSWSVFTRARLFLCSRLQALAIIIDVRAVSIPLTGRYNVRGETRASSVSLRGRSNAVFNVQVGVSIS